MRTPATDCSTSCSSSRTLVPRSSTTSRRAARRSSVCRRSHAACAGSSSPGPRTTGTSTTSRGRAPVTRQARTEVARCRSEFKERSTSWFLELSLAKRRLLLQRRDEVVDRDRRERQELDAAPRRQLGGDACDRPLIGRVDDADEVVWAEDGVLRLHGGAELRELLVDFLDALGLGLDRLRPLVGEGAEHDEGGHGEPP